MLEYNIKYNIRLEDFACSFGTDIDDIRHNCSDIISNKDFNYSPITGNERDLLILDILKKTETDKQIIGDNSRKKVWNDGWRENLDEFINNNYDLNKIIPKFFKPGPKRYNLKYIQNNNPNFEFDYYSVFRQWLFKKYLNNYNHIYEFGSGTGFNLVALSQLFPDKKLYGLDFVQSSIEIINTIADRYKYNLKGYLFDMIYPDRYFNLEDESAIFTVGSVEQLAGKFEKFIEYLLNQPISISIHVEPIIELYDENNLIDYLAIKFQSKRGYSKGLLPYLKKLESDKIIDIIKEKRLYFGNVYMEGYNLIIWKPHK